MLLRNVLHYAKIETLLMHDMSTSDIFSLIRTNYYLFIQQSKHINNIRNIKANLFYAFL